jgi:hypothetical protein
MKHSLVARDARITPGTSSRTLTDEHQRPGLDTITRLAHAVNENAGWILGEFGFTLSAVELTQLREVVRFLDSALLNAPLPHTILPAKSNAFPVKVRKRDIPRPLAALGVRAVYQVTDASLAPLGVVDGDLVYVRPLADMQAAGRVVACNLRGEPFAKVLEVDDGSVRLISPTERYAWSESSEAGVQLVGAVVGGLQRSRNYGRPVILRLTEFPQLPRGTVQVARTPHALRK